MPGSGEHDTRENRVRSELRRGRSYVTPGGCKFWPALDNFNAIVQERDALAARVAALEHAAEALLKRHVDLVESGDCGFWDVDAEPEVVAIREALAEGGK